MSDQEINQKQSRVCDYCNESKAVLYCSADTAKLCFSCDREVHSANQLFTRHTRSQLCDACDDSPASIFCETEQSVFCSNCDWESHKFHSSSLHNRRPIEGFTGCPSVTELVSFVGIEDLGDKAPVFSEREGGCGDGEEDEWLDLLSWETPMISSFDDLLVSSDLDHGFNPTDVLPLPKNRNASCGQHKVDVIHQLRELAKSEPTLGFGRKTAVKAIDGFQPRMPDTDSSQQGTVHTSCKIDTDPISFPAYESSALRCFNDNVETTKQVLVPVSELRGHTEETGVVPDKHLDSSRTIPVIDSLENQQHQNDAGTTSALPKVAVLELNSQERDSAISRYKEKRKTRRFDKHIRYESRKVRAESRTRIKGRFAKIER